MNKNFIAETNTRLSGYNEICKTKSPIFEGGGISVRVILILGAYNDLKFLLKKTNNPGIKNDFSVIYLCGGINVTHHYIQKSKIRGYFCYC